MAKLLTTIEIDESEVDKGTYCIPSATGFITLCGHCDVPYAELDVEEHPPNCRECLNIVKYCKKLTLPKAG